MGSVEKSKFMIFGLKKKMPPDCLNIYNSPIERVKVFKFLGLWFDEKLTWKVHIDKSICKSEKVINIMRSLSESDWGAERYTLHLIYRAMVRPILDYGSVVFGAASKAVLKRLDGVQSKALRICCGALRTTSIPALLVEIVSLL